MRLTQIDKSTLPNALARFASHLQPGPQSTTTAANAFGHIARTAAAFGAPFDTSAHREAACTLAERFGIPTIDQAPAAAFSWDGKFLRTRSEASVLVHEIAHWQLAPADRRLLPDFGLGAGPETGRVTEADAVRRVTDSVKEREELLASLLGILWEAALGQPAIHAFIEQNWLEAWERPAAGDQFRRTIDELSARGLIGADGVPCDAAVDAAVVSDPL